MEAALRMKIEALEAELQLTYSRARYFLSLSYLILFLC